MLVMWHAMAAPPQTATLPLPAALEARHDSANGKPAISFPPLAPVMPAASCASTKLSRSMTLSAIAEFRRLRRRTRAGSRPTG